MRAKTKLNDNIRGGNDFIFFGCSARLNIAQTGDFHIIYHWSKLKFINEFRVHTLSGIFHTPLFRWHATYDIHMILISLQFWFKFKTTQKDCLLNVSFKYVLDRILHYKWIGNSLFNPIYFDCIGDKCYWMRSYDRKFCRFHCVLSILKEICFFYSCSVHFF